MGADGMAFAGFAEGYRHADPNVSEQEIKDAWNNANSNVYGYLSRDEFFRMVGEEPGDEKDAQWYWNEFAEADGMAYNGFFTAYRHAEPTVSEQEIKDAWNN